MCAVMVLPAPMLATNGQPTGSLDAWRIEPKLDGYRTVVGITPTELVVRTRRGRNISDRLPELARLGEIGVELVLDGELIDGAGRPEDFYGLAGAITARQRRAPLTFVAFDLLACNGNSMVQRPQHERRRLLEYVAHLADGQLHIVPSYPSADLDALLVSADELSLEGRLSYTWPCLTGVLSQAGPLSAAESVPVSFPRWTWSLATARALVAPWGHAFHDVTVLGSAVLRSRRFSPSRATIVAAGASTSPRSSRTSRRASARWTFTSASWRCLVAGSATLVSLAHSAARSGCTWNAR